MHQKHNGLNFSKLVILVGLILFMGTLPMHSEEKETPGTPAEKRAREVIDLINQANPKKWQEYIEENLTKEFLEVASSEMGLTLYRETCDIFGRVKSDPAYKDEGKDYEIMMNLLSPDTDSWVKLTVAVEEEPPHKISSIGLMLTDPPEDKRPEQLSDQDIVNTLAQFMENLAKGDKFSGTVLLAKNDKILFKGAFGLASIRYGVPNKLDTKFNLGSMNKMFTAVAVAQLVEAGKLSYDDPVGKYLDADWVHPETAQKVKIKHLLTHTSGLGNFFSKEFVESSRLMYRGIDDWKALINQDKPKFEPGTSWSYSNSGMFLLGPIIEKASGQGYYDYIREHIYKPAGMINSGCFDNDRPIPNLAIGYEKRYTAEGFYWRNNIFDHTVKGGPAGGGFSTVEDLFRFARALHEGKLVSKETAEVLTTPKPELNSRRYGYGFGVTEEENDTEVGHTGGYTGISAVLTIFKKSGYTYAVLSNHSNGIDLVWVKLSSMLPPPGS